MFANASARTCARSDLRDVGAESAVWFGVLVERGCAVEWGWGSFLFLHERHEKKNDKKKVSVLGTHKPPEREMSPDLASSVLPTSSITLPPSPAPPTPLYSPPANNPPVQTLINPRWSLSRSEGRREM